jgi:pimeloyl-ACP methyl ester carboxylesterase
LKTPQMQRLGPLFARQIEARGMEFIELAWHDPSKITPDVIESYRKPLRAENWDKALWQMTLASQESDLPERLNEIRQPTLVITGDEDRIVPTEQSLRLADEFPDADLSVISQCGHLPQEECPDEFMQALTDFLQTLQE